MDAAGNLYGTTQGGGAYNRGTVFRVDDSGNEVVLYSFTGSADGSVPKAGLLMDAAGNLYGTTYAGGAYGRGTLFRLEPNGTEIVVHDFGVTGQDGSGPLASLIRDDLGNLYGTTYYGGAYNVGVVFELRL